MSHFDEIGLMYVDALTALHAACFEKPWDKAAFTSLLMLPTTQGFINESAFIVCSICAEEAEILTLGVVPEARHQGVGYDLILHTVAHFKKMGVTALFLEVSVQNTAALALYRKTGFVEVGRRPAYYPTSDGTVDALVLKKKL